LEFEMGTSDEDLVADTLEFWQARTAIRLTEEDARQIIDNLTEWIEILESWEEE
jgi:hypothetical protein